MALMFQEKRRCYEEIALFSAFQILISSGYYLFPGDSTRCHSTAPSIAPENSSLCLGPKPHNQKVVELGFTPTSLSPQRLSP